MATGVVFMDENDLSLLTRQREGDRIGKFVVIREKNRPEKRKINKVVSGSLLLCLGYVLREFSRSINPLCTVLKDV